MKHVVSGVYVEFQLWLVINGIVTSVEPAQYGQRQEVIEAADKEEIELEGCIKGVHW